MDGQGERMGEEGQCGKQLPGVYVLEERGSSSEECDKRGDRRQLLQKKKPGGRGLSRRMMNKDKCASACVCARVRMCVNMLVHQGRRFTFVFNGLFCPFVIHFGHFYYFHLIESWGFMTENYIKPERLCKSYITMLRGHSKHEA